MGCPDLSWSPQGAGGVPSKAACGHCDLNTPRVPWHHLRWRNDVVIQLITMTLHVSFCCFCWRKLGEGEIQTISALATTCKVCAWSKFWTPQNFSKLRPGFRFRPIPLSSVDFSSSAVLRQGRKKPKHPRNSVRLPNLDLNSPLVTQLCNFSSPFSENYFLPS